jgi:hypothetical protein
MILIFLAPWFTQEQGEYGPIQNYAVILFKTV